MKLIYSNINEGGDVFLYIKIYVNPIIGLVRIFEGGKTFKMTDRAVRTNLKLTMV